MRAKKADSQTASSHRVIVYTPEPAAGAGQYVAEFVKGIAAAGVPTILFCPDNFAYKQDVERSGAQLICGPVRDVRTASLWHRIIRNLEFVAKGTPKFWATVRETDIVHFQFGLRFGLGLLFSAIARMKGALVVVTAHDPLPHRWILPRPFRFFEKTLLTLEYSSSNHLIVHNQRGKQILTDVFRKPSSSVSVIPHGPLHPIAAGHSYSKQQTSGEPLRLLVFGSLRENKGLHLSIAALQRLQREGTDHPVALTIAGSLPNFMERDYWARCLRMILVHPANIQVLERTFADEEIADLFAAHDAVLLPYVDFYSESGVAMLALSQQRPILATSAGGFGELLRETDCGILIESPTEDAVVAAIKQAAAIAPELLRRKGWNGYRHALTHRSWNAIAERTKTVYDTLARERLGRAEASVVLHTPEPASSAALYVDALSAALTADSVALRVVCPANHRARDVMEHNPLIDLRLCRERATSMRVSLFKKFAQNLRFVLSSCRTLLAAFNPGDIAHFQYILHLPFGLIFFCCAKAKRAHIVFTVHDPVPHKFLLPGVLRELEMGSLSLAYRWSDVLIVHSEAGRRKLLETFHVSPGKIRVIVHGPYELKEKVRACPASNRLEVLFFGSLRENKGLHLAIEAVQQLAADGAAIRLTIAGQVVNRKEQKYWERCRTLIHSASGAIRLIERFVSDDELPDLFSQHHCFVLPYTTFSSDSGVAYMALANGKPIVSTDAGGLGWLLECSGGGLRIPVATVAGVVVALRQAIDLGPETLEQMGHSGAEWIVAECGWPKVARDTRKVYAEFLPRLSGAKMPTVSPEEGVELVGACHE